MLFSPSRDLRRLFEVSGLETYFDVRPKRASAHGEGPERTGGLGLRDGADGDPVLPH